VNEYKLFYKYMGAETAHIVLTNQTPRWSTPGTLNDPYDMQFDLRYDIDRNIVRRMALEKLWEAYEELLKDIRFGSFELDAVLFGLNTSEEDRSSLVDLAPEAVFPRRTASGIQVPRRLWNDFCAGAELTYTNRCRGKLAASHRSVIKYAHGFFVSLLTSRQRVQCLGLARRALDRRTISSAPNAELKTKRVSLRCTMLFRSRSAGPIPYRHQVNVG
jgi:hypothetical protein